uniref:Uncharacterized protein n=1 Tax=Gasterosteus aculeatus TaxID=69293 RepID=G3PLH5_GASAC
SLENFLNKVNECLLSPSCSFSFSVVSFVGNKNKASTFFCQTFFIIGINMNYVSILLIVRIFITWVSVSTLIFIHILPHLDT